MQSRLRPADIPRPARQTPSHRGSPCLFAVSRRLSAISIYFPVAMDRRQSQIIGILALVALLFCLACIRYYLRLG